MHLQIQEQTIQSHCLCRRLTKADVCSDEGPATLDVGEGKLLLVFVFCPICYQLLTKHKYFLRGWEKEGWKGRSEGGGGGGGEGER